MPPGVPLVAGMTATVTIPPALVPLSQAVSTPSSPRSRPLADVFEGPPPGPTAPAITTDHGGRISLPVEVEEPGLIPGQINPGLAPG